MNEEYLLGAYESFGGQEVLKTDFNTWVSKIKDNEEYKQGMFNSFGGQEKLQADYSTWNTKVFGEVKKKDNSKSIVQDKNVVSDGTTKDITTSSDIQEPKLPNTVSAPDNTIGIQEPVKLDKETFRNNVSNGLISDDVKKITENPKAYKDTFIKQRDLFNADDISIMKANIKALKQKSIDALTPDEARGFRISASREQSRIRDFKLQRIKSENEFTKDIQNRIEQNGGDVNYLTPQEIQSLGLNPDYLKTNTFKVDGKDISPFDLKNKLFNRDFISDLQSGKSNITIDKETDFAKEGIFPQNFINEIENLKEKQSNSGSEIGDFAQNLAGALTSTASSLLKVMPKTLDVVLDEIGNEELKVAFNSVSLYTDQKYAYKYLDNVTENLHNNTRAYRDGIANSIRSANFLDAGVQITNSFVEMAPLIALSAIQPELAPILFGLSAYGEKLDTLDKEKQNALDKQYKGYKLSKDELNASKYTALKMLSNAGATGLMNWYLFGGLTKNLAITGQAEKFAGKSLLEIEKGLKLGVGKGFKNFGKEIINQEKFFLKMNLGGEAINFATGTNTDGNLAERLKDDAIKGLAFAIPFYYHGLYNKRSNLKKAQTELTNKLLSLSAYDAKETELFNSIGDIRKSLENKDLSEENRKIITEHLDKLTKDNDVLIKTKEDVLNDIPFKKKLEFAQRYEKILKFKESIDKIGKDTRTGQSLTKEYIKLNEDYKTDLSNATEINLQDINKHYAELVKQANDVGIDTPKGQELIKESEKVKEEFKTITNEVKNPEETKVKEILPKQDKKEKDVVYTEDKNSITDAIDNKEVYVYDGKKGVITTDGQQVIFESGKDIFELGNKDELSTATLDKFGITKDATRPIIDDNNNVTIDGKKYLNNYNKPESAITKNKDGYTVTLETETGEKRNFRGAKADEIVYQYKLKKAYENETELTAKIEEAHRIADEAIATQNKIREAAPKRETKSIRKVEPIEVKPKEKDLFSETQTQGDTKPNANLKPKIEPSVPKGENKYVQTTVKPTADKGDTKIDILNDVKNINIGLKSKNITGRLLTKRQSENLQKEIEDNYTKSIENIFGNKNNDIRMKVFNFKTPLAEKTLNGINLRIVEGLIRNKKKTYLLYADGKIIGEFDSVDNVKEIVRYIETNLTEGNKDVKVETYTTSDSQTHQIVKKGDVIKYEGKDYEVTSGNEKYRNNKNHSKFTKDLNIPYFRGKPIGAKQDYLLHTNRIDGFKDLQGKSKELSSLEKKMGMSYDDFKDGVISYIGGELFDKNGDKRQIVGFSFNGKNKDGVIIRLNDKTEINIKNHEILDLIDNTGKGPKIISKKQNSKIKTKPKPRKLDNKTFYIKYKAIHKDIRSKTNESKLNTKENIKKVGFNEGVNVNALPLYEGMEKSTNIISRKFGVKKGDIIYILPKDGFTEGRNGYKTKKGFKPNDSEIIEIKYDNQPIYEAYLDNLKNAEKPATKMLGSLRGKTPLDKRALSKDKLKALKKEVTHPEDIVKQYFIAGGRVLSTSIHNTLEKGDPNYVSPLYRNSPGELRARIGYVRTAEKGGETIEKIAHYLWEQYGEVLKIDDQTFKDAVENVVSNNISTAQMAKKINESFYDKENVNESGEQLFDTPYGKLTQDDINRLEYQDKVKNDYLNLLTEKELLNLQNNEEQFRKYEKTNPTRTRGLEGRSSDKDAKRPNLRQKGNGNDQGKKKEITTSPEIKEIDTKIKEATDAVKTAKTALDNKAKTLDKTINKDQEDLFGKRESQQDNALFDERVDLGAREKATEKERQSVIDAENNLKDLKEKRKELLESGSVTEYLDFNEIKNTDISKDLGLNKIKNLIDKAENDLKKFGDENLSIGLPIVVAKVMLKAMKVALETVKTGADVISAGINAIKATDWYKNLNEQDRKNLIELKVKSTDVFSIVQKELKAEIKKGELRSERLKTTTKKLRQKHKDLKSFQIEIVKHVREKLDAEDIPVLTKSKVTQMMRKIVGLNENSTKRVLNEVDYIISEAKYKTAVNKVLRVLKTPKDYIEKVGGRPKAKGIDNNSRKALKLMQDNFNLSAKDIQEKINEASANLQDYTFEDYHALNIALDIAKAREINSSAETLKSEKYLKVTNVEDRNLNIKLNEKKSDNQTFLKDEAWRKMNGVVDEVKGFIGNGKSLLKEQLLKEHTRLKEITTFAAKDTEHEFSGLTKLEIQNKKFDKKTNILNKIFGKLGTKESKFRLIPTTVNTFEFLLNYINKNADSDIGNIYKYFYKNDTGIVKADGDFKKAKEGIYNEINGKIKEVLGTSFVKLYSEYKHQKEINTVHEKAVTILNEEGKREDQGLSIGQAINAHLVLKMEDARGKLEKQGWDAVTQKELETFLGEKYLKLSDFITDLIASKKDRYKSKFLEINRTDMGDIPNYFPTKIEKIDLKFEVNLGESTFTMPSVNSPHTIDRVQHNNRIDISRNAFEVLDEYFDSMEKFYNYARLTKDLNAMLSNNNFRNNVKTYDNRALSDLVKLSKAIIGDKTEFETNDANKTFYTLNAAVAAGYISGKLFTAFKQIVSLGAYTEFADSKKLGNTRIPIIGKASFMAKSLVRINPYSIYKNYKFFKKNSDHFRNRIKRGTVGDEFILSFLQGQRNKNLLNQTIKKIVKIGIKPNVLMDAITIATGGKVYYDQQLKKYAKVMSKSEAHKLAIRDFDIAFKKTQQSADFSELSPLQLEKGALTAMVATFKNSQFSYLRRAVTNKNNIVNRFSRKKSFYKSLGYKDAKAGVKALKFVLGDGKTHNDIENLLIYTHVLPLAWQFVASGLPGLLTKWDDQDTEEMKRALYLGPADGVFAIGDISKFAYNTAVLGKNWELKSNILFDQIATSFREMSKAYKDAGEYNKDVLLSVAKNALIMKSINADTFKNIYDGTEDLLLNGNYTQENIMKIMNAPRELKEDTSKSGKRHKVKRKKIQRYN